MRRWSAWLAASGLEIEFLKVVSDTHRGEKSREITSVIWPGPRGVLPSPRTEMRANGIASALLF